MKKDCTTCDYADYTLYMYPCIECHDNDKWELPDKQQELKI